MFVLCMGGIGPDSGNPLEFFEALSNSVTTYCFRTSFPHSEQVVPVGTPSFRITTRRRDERVFRVPASRACARMGA